MLACKVGERTINTIDYTDEQLRKWHKKNILKCPICGGLMYYRNGEIKVAYFAHQPGSDCTEQILGGEPETEEHRQSIKDIYLYLKNQEGVTDIILESWIRETRQRPDITFTYKDQKYALEVQCSPVATEYLERHRLYELAGIKDIWILGLDKYKGNLTADGYFKTKTIERQLLYKENQKLMYYNCNKKNLVMVSEGCVEAILDRKTTFNFNFQEKQLKDISIEELLEETNYKKNRDSLIKLIKQSIENQCDAIFYNYYLQSLNKRVLAYFQMNKQIYVIDYIPEYLCLADCNKLIKQYEDINIKSFIFLNYDLYKGVHDGDSFENNYYKNGYNFIKFKECINEDVFFIYNETIRFFTVDKNDENINLIEKIEKYSSFYNIYDFEFKYYYMNDNYKTIINNSKIKEQSLCSTDEIISYLKKDLIIRHFRQFNLNSIVFKDGCIINENPNMLLNDIIKSKQLIYDILLNKNTKLISEYVAECNDKLEQQKKSFDMFKDKLKKLFDKNDIRYNLDFTLDLLDENENNIQYKNLIFFSKDDKQYIIYFKENDLIHNKKGLNIEKYIQNDEFIIINIFDIDDYLTDDWILCKNYYDVLEFRFIHNLNVKIEYNYPKIINDEINLNLFYKNKHKKVKSDIKYNYLPRYNFMEMAKKLKDISAEVVDLKNKKICDIIDNINYDTIYDNSDFNVIINNEDIDKTIKNSLYPITVVLEEHDITRDLNIMLNPIFTIEKDKGFKLWIIKDFISVLNEIGINNITNVVNDYYEE